MTGVNAYILIMTLNVNVLISPINRYRVMNGKRHKTNYILPSPLTSPAKTHIDWKWKDGKRHSTLLETQSE
jgi:hypothetical protein